MCKYRAFKLSAITTLAITTLLSLPQVNAAPTITSSNVYSLSTPCNPISRMTCALPYPSDVYTLPDESSPTGKRLLYPEGVVDPELLKDVPPSLTPQTVFNGSSGYSLRTHINNF